MADSKTWLIGILEKLPPDRVVQLANADAFVLAVAERDGPTVVNTD